MAKRFGGKFSPDGSAPDAMPHADRPTARSDAAPAYRGAKVAPAGARSNVMFIPGVMLAFFALGSPPVAMLAGLAGAAALVLGAWLLRDGLKAEAAYHDRKVARRPAIPRKIFAALLCGAGVGLAVWRAHQGIVAPVLFGFAATALHFAAFGIDPMSDKGMEGIDSFQQDRVARVVDEAEAHLTAMADAVKRADDAQVEARVERLAAKVREMIRTVEEDPRDLTAARKFLGVYLMGARDAAAKFADVYARSRDRSAKSDFMMLLTDLEASFDQKHRALLLDDNADLNVEIEVLRDRLQREGVHLSREMR
ncbi:5-bromo-4-chloroindolyl phosphate hydrolysis family protein [Sagittula salina]|uniref:5-bromo-4-chloroindolyl phosphate hydrolysis family protein n=1 Tax=Sagittula salina TaxID=2820268 RepID=A0A940MM55_9RHOB|nr:5-bromo-4-chloroindolyl phosphate hydrolysis family protein [Sagittula salina]MBP0482280.1 5-bromo-4-chloroindolyl phosphate hydrolysis family protein [Sagittula salina]